MDKLSALIFDVDGTLADTERDGHRVAFNRAFEEAGLDWFWDEARYGALLRVTGGKERIRLYLSEERPDLLQAPDIDERIRALHAAKTRHYLRLLEAGAIPLRPGVRRLLLEARTAGLRLAIATTTTPENVTTLLRSTLGTEGLQWFEVIAAGDIVPAKKPAPDIFRLALSELGLAPNVCLALEDSGNGLRAALGAGLPTVVTTSGYTRDEDFSGAVAVLNGFGEPGAPVTVQAGSPPAAGYVDLASLVAWHREARSRAGIA
ncbi:HAD-IA family hydrolase [Thioalkalivibrio sp.]|uniref:HAD-IA family hydrolase n=1 Tax=Thioalkalivibrio sp. TaxID=2093813 RepID=UPI0035682BA3